MKTQKYLNTAVEPAVKRQIRIAAAREDCSMSEFVRRAIEARIVAIEVDQKKGDRK